MMRFAKYGIKEVVVFTTCWTILIILTILTLPYLIPIPLVGLILTLSFFRDPIRIIPQGDFNLVAPADGKIVEISDAGDAYKIGIFLSIFNVHINRAPCHGKVKLIKYQEGGFLNAMNPESAAKNESNTMVIENEAARIDVTVRQISGAIARRIVCDCKEGDYLAKGQKFGMIKFGSRTELLIPKSVEVKLSVKIGDKVTAGETILAEIAVGNKTEPPQEIKKGDVYAV